MKFVGRSVELAALAEALEPAPTPRVVWISGPAGAGKTALARHFLARAAGAGHAVQWVACDESDALRDEIATRFERLRAAGGHEGRTTVLVLDGFDRFEVLDRWLLEEGAQGLVLVTARRRAAASLRTRIDPPALLREQVLGNLAPPEIVEALAHAGVPGADHERAIGLTKGHPLTLALVLERFAREPHLPLSLSDEPDILGDVVADLLRDAPATAHRLALYVLAIAGILDEALLGRATGAANADELFAHLAKISIVERSKHGLLAQSLVRDVIYREHALRNPEEHAVLVSRIAEALRERRRQARSSEEALRLDCQAAFVEAPSAALRECCDFRFLADVVWRCARPPELLVIAGLIEQLEGSDARRRFESAGARVATHALVRRDGTLAAFAVIADPDQRRASLQWVGSPGGVVMGREVWTALVALEATLRAPEETRELSFVVPAESPLARHLPALGFARFGSHREGPTATERIVFLLSIAPGEDVASARASAESPLAQLPSRAPMERATFDAAWRAALPLLHRPLELAGSALLGTELGRDGPPGLLIAATSATAALASASGYADSARVLDVSFIHPAAKQEAAAAALGVPFGTYRYQLRKAIALLLEELWRREQSALGTPIFR